MAKLQHMCLCECDNPPQIKTISVHLLYHKFSNAMSGCWESNPVYTNPNRMYNRYTTARFILFNSNSTLIYVLSHDSILRQLIRKFGSNENQISNPGKIQR